MKKQKKKNFIIAAAVLCLGAGAAAAGITGKAIFQETDAVHIEADKIEESTLLIGTHLIYLGALDDQIYEIALQSAQESGQNNIYYKSELAEGAWYEISSAYSIADITAQGIPVTEQEIEKLWLTHHTKSDGITYDLRSKTQVNTYDIYPAYDLETMKELEPVKNQYELYKDGGKKSNLVERNKKLIRRMFGTKVTSKETETYDLKLNALSAYLKILRENKGASDEIEAVEKIIDKTDDGRRVLVYQKVAAGLEKLSDGVASENGIKSSEFQLDAALLEAVSESQENIENSLTEKEGTMLKEGIMVMTREEYNLAGRLTTAALQKDYSACDEETAKLIALYHIMDGEIIDKAGEIKLLEEDLIPMAEHVFTERLSAGESGAYRQAVEKKSSHVILEGIQAEEEQQCTTARSELQFYIESRIDRMEVKEAQEYAVRKLEAIDVLRSGIPKDQFQKIAEQSAQAYKVWLQNMLADLAKKQGNQELDNLYEEKAKLEAERLDALDREELTEAKQKEALLEAKERQIQDHEDAISREVKKLEEKKRSMEQEAAGKQEQGEDVSGLLAGITSIENEIEILLAGIPENSGISSIQEQKDNIKKLLEAGGLSEEAKTEMTAGIKGLGARIDVNGSMAADALKEIYQSMASAKFLKDTTEYDGYLEQIEEIIASHADTLDQVLDTEEIAEILDEALGYQIPLTENTVGNSGESQEDVQGADGNSSLSGKKGSNSRQAVAAAALALYGEQAKNSQLNDMLAGMAAAASKQDNSYFFPVVNKGSGSCYASVKSIASYKGYRYVWNDNQKKAMLVSGGTYYGFTAFRQEVEREKEKKDTMTMEAAFQATVFLPEDYLEQEFGCRVYILSDTGYGVLVDEAMLKEAAKVSDLLVSSSKRKGQ